MRCWKMNFLTLCSEDYHIKSSHIILLFWLSTRKSLYTINAQKRHYFPHLVHICSTFF